MAYRSADGGYGAGASVFHLDSSHPDYVVIPDAGLLFHGALQRAGPDLRLTGEDGRHHIIPGYFASEKHPALVAPNGARLSADLVDLLAGSPAPAQYAQANAPLPPDAIGKVEKVVGNVEVIRNGTAVALNVGDAVYKSDIIQTGTNSQCGIDFPDGSALNLVANTRMALNDYSYDPNSSNNSAAFSIVAGTFAFVAGKVAHSGDMSIATPVATMGIRGTIGTGQQVDDNTWAFTVDDGVYVLLDINGNELERVFRIGYRTLIHEESNGTYTVTTLQMTSSEQQLIQELVRDVIQTLNLYNNSNPNTPQNQSPGSSTPPDQIEHLQLLLNENNGPPLIINVTVIFQGGTYTGGVNTGGSAPPPNNQGGSSSSTFIWNGGSGNWDTPGSWSTGSVPISPDDNIVVLAGTLPYNNNDNYTVDSLTVYPNAGFDISQGTLNVLNGVTDDGTIFVGGDPPTLTIRGPVTVGSGASLVAGLGGEIDFNVATITNEGRIAARHSGTIDIEGGTVTNSGRIAARGSDLGVPSSVTIDVTSVTNEPGGVIAALRGGLVTLSASDFILNDAGATIAASSGGVLTLITNVSAVNEGTIAASNGGVVVLDFNGQSGSGGPDPDNGGNYNLIEANPYGTIDIAGGIPNYGSIYAFGAYATVDFTPNCFGQEVQNFGGIGSEYGATINFEHITVYNADTGSIGSNDGGTVTFEHARVENFGGVTGGPQLFGISADGGSSIVFDCSHIFNACGALIQAQDDSAIVFNDSHVYNAGGAADDDYAGGIVAFGGSSITFDHSEVHNTGLIAAGFYGNGGDGGTVIVDRSTIDNACGTIWAINVDSSVQLFDSTIDGGTLTSAQGGYFAIDNGSFCPVIFAGVTLSDGSTIDIDPGATLALDCTTTLQDGTEIFGPAGFLNNSGIISVACGASASIVVDEIVNCGTIAAYGGGTLDLSAYVENYGTIAARGTDSVIGLNNSVVSGGTLFISCGATVDAGGSGAFLSGVNVIDNGTLAVSSGFLTVTDDSTVCGCGSVDISGGGVATFFEALDSNLSVNFGGGVLALAAAPVGTLVINSFGALDALNLLNVPTSDIASATFTPASGNSTTLTIDDESFTFAGDSDSFTLVSDTTGGTMILFGTEDEWTKTSHGGGAWGTTSNWRNGVPSGSTVNAVVDELGTYTITLSGGVKTVNSLTISDPDATLQGWGTISGGIINGGTIEALEASGGTLTLDDDVLNSGTLWASSGNTLKLEGRVVDNFGTITVDGTLSIDAASGILSLDSPTGTGTVTLAGGSIDAAVGQTLANWGNTIEGYGHIGHGTGNLTLENFDGTIDATVSGHTLTIDTGNDVFNGGLLEATNHGTLAIDDPLANDGTIAADVGTVDLTDTVVADSGTVEAVSGGIINLDGVEINGGALTIASSTVNVGGPGALLSGVTVTDNGALNVNGGFLVVRDNSTVSGDGSIGLSNGGIAVFYDALNVSAGLSVNYDGGVLALDAAPCGGTLDIDDFGVNGGALNLLDVPFADSASAEWSSDGGSGTILTIGGESFDFVNVGSCTGSDFTLVSDGTGGTAVLPGTEDEWINPTGMRPWNGSNDANNWSTGSAPTGGENAVIHEPGTYTITLSGGTKTANSLIISDPDATLQGFGTISAGIINAGTIVASGGTLTLADDVLNSGTLSAPVGDILKLQGSAIENVGNIAIGGELSIAGQDGVVPIDSGNGAGTVTLTGGSIDAAVSDQTLVNLGNTIWGYGTIGAGDGHLTLENIIGTIDANVNGLSLTLDTGNTVVNAALLEATNGGILDIQDSTIDNTGTILIDGISSLLIDGNNPSSVGNTIIANNVSLTGRGEVSLQGGTITENADNGLVTSSGAILALDNVDNTISGSGTIGSGDGHLQLTNAGTIDANFAGEPLVIHIDDDSSGNSTNAVINTGTLEATGGGQLDVLDPVNNAGGTVNVSSNGFVDFFLDISGGNATIDDGTLYFGWSSDVNVTFTGSYGTLAVNSSEPFGGTISGLAAGDTIDLTGIAPPDIASVTIGASTIVVTETAGAGGAQYTLDYSESLSGDQFVPVFDGNGGTDLVLESNSNVDHWVAGNGDWATGTDWSQGTPPTANAAAIIDASGGGYTLTITSAQAANTVTIAPAAAGVDVQDETGGSLAITGALTIEAGSFSLIGGTLTAASIYVGSAGHFIAEGAVSAPLDNDGGFVEAYGNLALSGAVTGTGNFQIDNGNTLEFGSSVDGGTVTFGATTGELELDAPSSFQAVIADFTGSAPDAAHSDVIDLAGINYNPGSFTESYNSTTGVLTVSDGTDSATLTFNNFYGTFKFASDGSGGTDIFDPPANSSGPSASITNDSFTFHHDGAGGDDAEGPAGTPGLGQWTAAEIQQWLGSHDEGSAAVTDFAHNDAAAHWHAAAQHAFHLH